MAQPAAIPAPSIPSSVVAPSVASQSPIQAPASYPTAQPAYSPEPQVSIPQANPWQAAYQGLLASLNGTQPSQPQAFSSPQIPQAAPSPAYYPSAVPSYQAVPSVSAPLTSAFPQTPAYSPAMYPSQAPTSAPGQDEYLQSVSAESLEVLNHFGAEAPALLNRYACVVEDALLNQARQTAQAMQQLQVLDQQVHGAAAVVQAAAEDNAAYHTLLTNPDLLANYVSDFYGPNGPYPTETAQDRLAAEVAANERFFGGQPQEPSYQRPQFDMPAPAVQASGTSSFWNEFSRLSEMRPDVAWQYLSQATPADLASKVLVSEG